MTDTQSSLRENNCDGCDHTRGRHFRDVDGVVRCLVVASGVSDRGVIGIPWSAGCDCVNFISPQRTRERADKERQQEQRTKAITIWVEAARKNRAIEEAKHELEQAIRQP